MSTPPHPRKGQITAALGTCRDWGATMLPSGSPVCRCKEDAGWSLDLFAKRMQRKGGQ